MKLRSLTCLALLVSVAMAGSARCEDKPAPAAKEAAAAETPSAAGKPATAKPAAEAAPVAPLLPRLRGQGVPNRKQMGEAARATGKAGIGAALRAVGDASAEPGDPEAGKDAPPVPLPGEERPLAPPGGFADDDEGPLPPLPAGAPLLRPRARPTVDAPLPPLEASADPELDKLNTEEAMLDARTRDLSARYRHADEAARGKIRAQLAEAIERHFEVRQQRRQLELERLAAHLDRLRGAIDKRAKARDVLVKQRLEQLIGEEQDAGF